MNSGQRHPESLSRTTLAIFCIIFLQVIQCKLVTENKPTSQVWNYCSGGITNNSSECDKYCRIKEKATYGKCFRGIAEKSSFRNYYNLMAPYCLCYKRTVYNVEFKQIPRCLKTCGAPIFSCNTCCLVNDSVHKHYKLKEYVIGTNCVNVN